MATDTAEPGVTPRDVPLARAHGVTLLGEVKGSGYRRAPSLVRRADGQTVQLTPLLYAVLAAIDGRRTPAAVARTVAEETGRPVSEGDVRTLVDRQLRPLGLLRSADGREPEVTKADPLLGLRFRYVVSDPERTRRLTAPFAVLFAPVVVALVTAAFLACAGWVLFEKGLAGATAEAFERPGLLLLVFAVTALSAGFHEFGHAAACRYGGATPGAMGAGLYLVWPAFYTDVTDSYRLSRAARVRVDLGGLYFNAIVAVAIVGAWALSGFDALLLVVATQLLQMVRQLAPVVRFDGYHVLADLTGVPDLYAHIGPTLRGLLPGRRRSETQALRGWARGVVAAWVAMVVPLLLATLVLLVVSFPRVAATAWRSLGHQADALGVAFAEVDPVAVGGRVIAIVAIALPVLATAYVVARVARRAAGGAWRWSEERPLRRASVTGLALLLVAGILWAWWPRPTTYEPIRPTESGTILDVLPAAGTTGLQEGTTVEQRVLWAPDETLPPKDEPRLVVVLVPREGDAPTWVFPFDRPEPPGAGDNQALAVNTTDGSTTYDVAFALAWATDGQALNTNEAYAFASCRRCTTVAVAFQVVLVVGQADVVVPQNLAGAVNYACRSCVTHALAQQLVVSLPEGLSPRASERIDALWDRVERFGRSLRGMSIDRIRARLARFERQILRIVREDARGARLGGSTATDVATTPGPSGSAVPGVTSTATPTPEPTSTPAPGETSATPTSTAESSTGPAPTATTTTASP